MPNNDKNRIENLVNENAKQKKTLTAFSIVNTVLLVAIIVIILVKTCAC